MPSVLVELDFICNPDMERFLNSENGRKKCARALANAISAYYTHHRRGAASSQAIPSGEEEQPASSKPTYHVQFMTSGSQLADGDKRLSGIDDAAFYREDGVYKYYSGTFPSLSKARKRLAAVRKKYPEAFIIKLRDGKRI